MDRPGASRGWSNRHLTTDSLILKLINATKIRTRNRTLIQCVCSVCRRLPVKTPFLNKQVPLTRWLHPEARKFQRGTLAPEVPMFRPPKSHTTFDMVHRDPGRCKAFTRLMLQAGPPPHNGQHINSPDLSPSLRCENCSNAVQRLKVLVTEMFKVLAQMQAKQTRNTYPVLLYITC